MRALVVGADGFVGRWLIRHLLECGDEVAAATGPRFEGTLSDSLLQIPLDVRLDDRVDVVLRETAPEAIYFLAAVSKAGQRDFAAEAVAVSVVGATNILAAASRQGNRVRLVHVGSSHMYEVPPDGKPIKEESPLRPAGVYGAVKVAAEAILCRLGPMLGVDVIAVRAFNHIGPGQRSGFVVPSLAQQVAIATRTGDARAVIHVGNVDVRRDFTDVRDVVRAYRLLAVHGQAGRAYNVASGTAVSIREMAAIMGDIAKTQIELDTDPALVRPDDPDIVVGDARRLTAETGWQPTISLRQTLEDVLAEWRRPGTSAP